ncbi:MAG TPA: SDR family NAD(P)-dependent oxidoreductase [Thermodesulfobacteriota bacterium]
MRLKTKKVLVTGSDGFIGSHLVEKLVDAGAHVRAFVYYNSFNSWGWLETLRPELLRSIEVFAGDIRDQGRVHAALEGMDAVFHLAALIGIPYSYHSPESYVSTNIAGTLNVLQAARAHDVERVLVTSTSEVYGTARYVPMDEAHPLCPQSPYSATKIASDGLAESFHRSFGLPVVIARPFNAYGPRQSARAVIPTIITQLINGSEVSLGSLHPRRDFNFVEDIAGGMIALAECDRAVGMTVNIGSGREISMKELAEGLIKVLNPGARIMTDAARERPSKSEVERLLCDNRRIKELTGWSPAVALEEGLQKTIEWMRNEGADRYKWNAYNV